MPEEKKKKYLMLKNVSYGDGKKTIKIEIGTIVICNDKVAKDLMESGAVKEYSEKKRKVVEL